MAPEETALDRIERAVGLVLEGSCNRNDTFTG